MGNSELEASLANVAIMGISLVSLLLFSKYIIIFCHQIFGIISALLVDRLGRRPLMLASFLAMILTNISIASLMYFHRHFQQAN